MNENQFFSSDFKLGILGGGQLGKMLLYDSIRYDIYTKIMDPNKNAPCHKICDEFIVGDLTDYEHVVNFCKDVDVVTVEIENVNTDALEFLEKNGKKVYPSSKTLKTIQNKSKQKDFYIKNNLPTSTYKNYKSKSELISDLNKGYFEFPSVWKSAKFGYDGKGVKIVKSLEDIKNLPDLECLMEQKVKIKKEVSVIVARNPNGEETCFPVVEMEFNDDSNLVEYVICPANISEELEEKACNIALQTARCLNSIGLLAVELFITENDNILINEVAPRPHNSGHHTIECCFTSQFDQHIRSILNLPLGCSKPNSYAIMVNLVGDKGQTGSVSYSGIEKAMEYDNVSIHIYGKSKTKPNRKMGHATVLDTDLENGLEVAKSIKKIITIKSK